MNLEQTLFERRERAKISSSYKPLLEMRDFDGIAELRARSGIEPEQRRLEDAYRSYFSHPLYSADDVDSFFKDVSKLQEMFGKIPLSAYGAKQCYVTYFSHASAGKIGKVPLFDIIERIAEWSTVEPERYQIGREISSCLQEERYGDLRKWDSFYPLVECAAEIRKEAGRLFDDSYLNAQLHQGAETHKCLSSLRGLKEAAVGVHFVFNSDSVRDFVRLLLYQGDVESLVLFNGIHDIRRVLEREDFHVKILYKNLWSLKRQEEAFKLAGLAGGYPENDLDISLS